MYIKLACFKIVAEGTPTQLKQQIAGDVVTLSLERGDSSIPHAQELLSAQPFVREIQERDQQLQVYVERGEESLAVMLRMLDGAGLNVRAVSLARPSLDDVFLRQTGHSITLPSS
jgi:ABC-2 type transport system ATP-binding protein